MSNYIQPLKSPCFDNVKPKVNPASSLKERIKLNKMMTISPKTGSRIGVSKNFKRDDIISPVASQVSNVHSKFDLGHGINMRSSQNLQSVNYRGTQYSSNMAFNLTYKTVNQDFMLSPK